MKVRDLIACLLIVVLSIPMLPVREVGQLLSSSQLTEEIPHADTGKTQGKIFQFQEEVIHEAENCSVFLSARAIQYITFSIKLPSMHEGDIPTPPPNLAA